MNTKEALELLDFVSENQDEIWFNKFGMIITDDREDIARKINIREVYETLFNKLGMENGKFTEAEKNIKNECDAIQSNIDYMESLDYNCNRPPLNLCKRDLRKMQGYCEHKHLTKNKPKCKVCGKEF